MKIPSISSLSYCALILLFGSINASFEDGELSSTPNMVDYTPHKEPSILIKLTVDPEHAWWQKALPKRQNVSPTETPVNLPTKCQYVAQNTQASCPSGCICDTACTGVFIWNASRPEPRPQYHICTNWNLNHGNQLRAGFQEIGFQVVPNRTRCGWQRFEGVKAMRVGRGNIDVNGTLDQPWGDSLELARIEKVMKQEYPFVEIIVICSTLVGPIFMFAGMIGWCAWANKEREVKYRRLPKA